MKKDENRKRATVIFAAALGAVSAYFNVLLIPLCVMVGVMLLDYVSGMCAAWTTKMLNSRVGIIGIIKKVGYLGLVAVGMAVDYLITSGLTHVGINLQINYCVGMIVTIWLIINELISILENLDRIGIPLPNFLVKIVNKLKNSIDEKTEDQ